MGWQRSAIDAPFLLGPRFCRIVSGLLLLFLGILLGRGDFQILDRQLQLIAIQPLRSFAKLGVLQLLQQVAKLVILLDQPLSFLNRGVAFGRQLVHQRP
jgi:hypothetical protein